MNDQQTPAPAPADAPIVPDASLAGSPPYYCPQCGARYFAPGNCTNQHPAAEILRDPAVPLATDTPAPAVVEDAAAGIVDAGTPETAAAPPAQAAPAAVFPPAVVDLPPPAPAPEPVAQVVAAEPVAAEPAPVEPAPDLHYEIATIVGDFTGDVQAAIATAHGKLDALIRRIEGPA